MGKGRVLPYYDFNKGIMVHEDNRNETDWIRKKKNEIIGYYDKEEKEGYCAECVNESRKEDMIPIKAESELSGCYECELCGRPIAIPFDFYWKK